MMMLTSRAQSTLLRRAKRDRQSSSELQWEASDFEEVYLFVWDELIDSLKPTDAHNLIT